MRQTALLLAGIALLSACRSEQLPTETANRAQPGAVASRAVPAVTSPAVLKDLATLRQATARFHQFKNAADAGWSTKITDCMADPVAGGMGYHYGNTSLIDGSVQVDSPELLLYEPDKNGGMSLVAVEYIIPYTAHSRDSDPPVLFGQQFTQNDVFQLWGLHAWVWKDNPSGMFANWNPQVKCNYASAMSTMKH